MVKSRVADKEVQQEICLKCEGSFVFNPSENSCTSLLELKLETVSSGTRPKLSFQKDYIIEARHVPLTADDF